MLPATELHLRSLQNQRALDDALKPLCLGRYLALREATSDLTTFLHALLPLAKEQCPSSDWFKLAQASATSVDVTVFVGQVTQAFFHRQANEAFVRYLVGDDAPSGPIDVDAFSAWFEKASLFREMCVAVMRTFIRLPTGKNLIPSIAGNRPSLCTDEMAVFLQYHLPPEAKSLPKKQWNMVYSSALDGQAWIQFAKSLDNERIKSTLLLFKDGNNYIFGAFAEQPWKIQTNFYGSSGNALFSLWPTMKWYGTTGYNKNFQYFAYGLQSITNGLGFGGQVDYFGLYISDDFMHGYCRASPISTTYGNPVLASNADFVITDVEVLCVEEADIDDRLITKEEAKGLAAHGEVAEFLEMSGRKMYSKDVRAEDEQVKKEDP